MPGNVPAELKEHKYVSLTTFRKNGVGVKTPVWFAESGSIIYVMTPGDSVKVRRIRNNPDVQVAPCTIRGKIAGPEFAGRARILPEEEWGTARAAMRAKYWITRITALWSRKNIYLEITL